MLTSLFLHVDAAHVIVFLFTTCLNINKQKVNTKKTLVNRNHNALCGMWQLKRCHTLIDGQVRLIVGLLVHVGFH
jgi:hypothetical protein